MEKNKGLTTDDKDQDVEPEKDSSHHDHQFFSLKFSPPTPFHHIL